MGKHNNEYIPPQGQEQSPLAQLRTGQLAESPAPAPAPAPQPVGATAPEPQADEGVESSSERGWIKVWRALKDHPRYRHDSEWVHVWLHLQLCATHQGMQRIFAGKKIMLKPGQLITGRYKIAEATGVHPSKVKRIIAQLKSDHQIDQQGSNRNSLITILEWATTQKSDQQNGQPVTNKRPATDQLLTTYKNGKKVKNGKKEKNLLRRTAEEDEFFKLFGDTFEAHHGQQYIDRGKQDTEAIRQLLPQLGEDPEKTMATLYNAWSNQGYWAERTKSIVGFAQHINEIREEGVDLG